MLSEQEQFDPSNLLCWSGRVVPVHRMWIGATTSFRTWQLCLETFGVVVVTSHICHNEHLIPWFQLALRWWGEGSQAGWVRPPSPSPRSRQSGVKILMDLDLFCFNYNCASGLSITYCFLGYCRFWTAHLSIPSGLTGCLLPLVLKSNLPGASPCWSLPRLPRKLSGMKEIKAKITHCSWKMWPWEWPHHQVPCASGAIQPVMENSHIIFCLPAFTFTWNVNTDNHLPTRQPTAWWNGSLCGEGNPYDMPLRNPQKQDSNKTPPSMKYNIPAGNGLSGFTLNSLPTDPQHRNSLPRADTISPIVALPWPPGWQGLLSFRKTNVPGQMCPVLDMCACSFCVPDICVPIYLNLY